MMTLPFQLSDHARVAGHECGSCTPW